eukprot:COSAG02_NODE_1753_length_11053_cov_5.509129_4_plen_73_part_00
MLFKYEQINSDLFATGANRSDSRLDGRPAAVSMCIASPLVAAVCISVTAASEDFTDARRLACAGCGWEAPRH